MKYMLMGAIIAFMAFTANAENIKSLMMAKKLKISCSGDDKEVHYVKPLKLKLTNASGSTINVEVPTGFIFSPNDSSFQDIVVTQQILATLAPGVSKEINMHGMCIEPSDHAPNSESTFYPDRMGDTKIVKLTQFIEKNGYFSGTAQQAVWALVDDRGLESITGFDSTEVNNLVAYMHDLTGKPIPPKPSADDYARNLQSSAIKVKVGGEMEYNIKTEHQVSWAMYDANGILVREMYNGPLGPGSGVLSYDYDATVYENPKYLIRLVVDGRIMYEHILQRRSNE